MEKKSKNARILEMYIRLCEGKLINKSEEALRYHVDERSIQRDIDDIRAFLSDRKASNASDSRDIVYDRIRKGFFMSGAEASVMTNSEILAVSKILLESRAFTQKEMNSILNKLVEGCTSIKNMKLVSDLIANEKYHYVELHHRSSIENKLWELGECIKDYNILEIKYLKPESSKECITRVIKPVAVLFSEYYFYLNGYIVEKEENGIYVQLYDYPTIFRLDRIKQYKKMDQKFEIPYSSRFEEGEFRKRIQFMYPGELMKLQFKYFGKNSEPVLDRIPTAKISEQNENYMIIEAEVFGKGIIMWLLSQGKQVEVIKPDVLRQKMKKHILEMLDRY